VRPVTIKDVADRRRNPHQRYHVSGKFGPVTGIDRVSVNEENIGEFTQ
jgi:hypothetical protein